MMMMTAVMMMMMMVVMQLLNYRVRYGIIVVLRVIIERGLYNWIIGQLIRSPYSRAL